MRAGGVSWALVLLPAFALTEGAAASDLSDQASLEGAQFSPYEALKQITTVGGLRSQLAQQGLQLTFSYYGDAFANPSGGIKQGLGYDGRFGTIIDADLEKLAGWSGATFHASIHQIHGSEFSVNNIGNLMTVSGIEAQPSTRLFNLWIEQKLSSDTTVRLGQFTAAQEFFVSQNANLFVNSTFGWPALPAQDLPSGGPAYPEAALGARVAFSTSDQLTLRAAIFDGDPAGPGPGNPVDRDPSGLAFRVNDPPLLIAEIAYAYNQQKPSGGQGNPHQEGTFPLSSAQQPSGSQSTIWDLPGTVKLGGWVHTGVFADQRFDVQGGLLAASNAQPFQHGGDFAIYGVVDQVLWRSGARSLNFFARAAATPSDRNPADFYYDTGFTLKAPIESRPNDSLGFGFAYGRISPEAAASDRDKVAITGMPMPIRDYEAAIELTYQMQITDNFWVQPDIQYIIHPGGHVPNPLDQGSVSPISNAAVVGMRTTLKF